MSLININKQLADNNNNTLVKCGVCNAVMNQIDIDLKDRLVRFVIGSNAVIKHYQCPECFKELITMEK